MAYVNDCRIKKSPQYPSYWRYPNALKFNKAKKFFENLRIIFYGGFSKDLNLEDSPSSDDSEELLKEVWEEPGYMVL